MHPLRFVPVAPLAVRRWGSTCTCWGGWESHCFWARSLPAVCARDAHLGDKLTQSTARRPQGEDDEMVRKTIVREVKTLRALQHENIVRLREAFKVRWSVLLGSTGALGAPVCSVERALPHAFDCPEPVPPRRTTRAELPLCSFPRHASATQGLAAS